MDEKSEGLARGWTQVCGWAQSVESDDLQAPLYPSIVVSRQGCLFKPPQLPRPQTESVAGKSQGYGTLVRHAHAKCQAGAKLTGKPQQILAGW